MAPVYMARKLGSAALAALARSAGIGMVNVYQVATGAAHDVCMAAVSRSCLTIVRSVACCVVHSTFQVIASTTTLTSLSLRAQ